MPLLGLIVLSAVRWVMSMNVAVAQSTPPDCQPPRTGEYLVLVRSPTPAAQEKLRRALPPNTNTIVCRYLNETVTRTGTFTQLDNANSQVQSIRSLGVAAFVVRPSTNPQASTLADPQPLGAGYAVLVEYFNRPETAAQVQQFLGTDVGLTSYVQRPYLLALHTSDQNKATETLKRLSDQGFYALLVNSRQVTLIRPKASP
ncbi:hypothetical protein IQ230_08440 [Gloeocapsopsis crepidinum LEGE 06123]|uniref:SPOR domain-containing protein n=2 Tax=Gloeocapsopsis crepidinum TaxID=693223 RepID=A0ABR9UQ27_9CHRO|nr:hypothetical protein [Gloeocapsopsis crepidinum LEGE 06123]